MDEIKNTARFIQATVRKHAPENHTEKCELNRKINCKFTLWPNDFRKKIQVCLENYNYVEWVRTSVREMNSAYDKLTSYAGSRREGAWIIRGQTEAQRAQPFASLLAYEHRQQRYLPVLSPARAL